MNTFINYVVALLTLLWGSAGIAAETRVIIINPRRCRTSWNSAQRLGCTQDTFQDILRPTDAYGCPEIPLPFFFSGSELARQSRLSAQRTI
jgi:hypothetical protein